MTDEAAVKIERLMASAYRDGYEDCFKLCMTMLRKSIDDMEAQWPNVIEAINQGMEEKFGEKDK